MIQSDSLDAKLRVGMHYIASYVYSTSGNKYHSLHYIVTISYIMFTDLLQCNKVQNQGEAAEDNYDHTLTPPRRPRFGVYTHAHFVNDVVNYSWAAEDRGGTTGSHDAEVRV